jgi:isocitrate dehydrogenase
MNGTTPKVPVTVAYGDGIGPEIMNASLQIMAAAGACLDIETIEIGEKVYNRGNSAGIESSAWESLSRTKVFYKAPITTPQGGGFKSLNVTTRKTLGLYANVRPIMAYAPFVTTKHPGMDVVIIRENEEDLYAGIEHRQTDEVFQCLKLITRPGCEKIVRYAFEYARLNQRKKVTCFTKDNIMKMTDGLFHRVFDEIAAEYPDLQADHKIIDIGAAMLADTPQKFDVIVTLNLYGDIISDIAAQIAGSVGLAGSANIGETCSMFEAIHGSAPDIAGKGIANPSGLLLAGVMMLVHIGQSEVAETIHNAWLRTLENGIHTQDIYSPLVSKQLVTTSAFTEAVIERLGQQPQTFPAIHYAALNTQEPLARPYVPKPPATKELVGVDIFLNWQERNAAELGAKLQTMDGDGLKLVMISNRGQKVWPNGQRETFCTDHWRCRFMTVQPEGTISRSQVIGLLQRLDAAGFDFIKSEHLCTFDGVPGFSVAQGQ